VQSKTLPLTFAARGHNRPRGAIVARPDGPVEVGVLRFKVADWPGITAGRSRRGRCGSRPVGRAARLVLLRVGDPSPGPHRRRGTPATSHHEPQSRASPRLRALPHRRGRPRPARVPGHDSRPHG